MTHRFQSTPPSRGGDSRLSSCFPLSSQFQSTPPRGGRLDGALCTNCVYPISIHAPREGGDVCSLIVPGDVAGISIHAPARGGDARPWNCNSYQPLFQSTPPARGATLIWLIRSRSACISIHAPREGGDSAHGLYLLPVCYFNPRPPRGGRHLISEGCKSM